MSGTDKRAALVLSLVGGLTLLFAAPSFAATNVVLDEDSDTSVLELDDQTNDADDINVSEAAGTITITDVGTGGITTADLADCTPVNANTVTCATDPVDPAPPAPPTAPVREINLDLNNGTDRFVNQNFVAGVNEDDANATGLGERHGRPGGGQQRVRDERGQRHGHRRPRRGRRRSRHG